MLFPSQLLHGLGYDDFQDLNLGVTAKKRELDDQERRAVQLLNAVFAALATIILALVLAGPSSLQSWLYLAFLVGLVAWGTAKSVIGSQWRGQVELMRTRYFRRVAAIPIRLSTLPGTVFVAILTRESELNIVQMLPREAKRKLQDGLRDRFIITPPYALEAPAAASLELGSIEALVHALATGMGECVGLPTAVEASVIAGLREIERQAIRHN